MSDASFYAVLAITTSLGVVVVVPKLHSSNYKYVGYFAVCVVFAGFTAVAIPREFDLLEKLARGLSTGITVVVLGLVKVWFRKKWPTL